MISFIFGLVGMVSVSGSDVSTVKANCETYAPNLEGISVTVCGGEVFSRRDASGIVHFAPGTY